jgi:hypothetical protein
VFSHMSRSRTLMGTFADLSYRTMSCLGRIMTLVMMALT